LLPDPSVNLPHHEGFDTKSEVVEARTKGAGGGQVAWKSPYFKKPQLSTNLHVFSEHPLLNFTVPHSLDLISDFSEVQVQFKQAALLNDEARFLFPLFLSSEQLTKAMMHFMELVRLSQLLGIVLVVPNVYHSVLHAKHKESHSLCLYFDCHALGHFTPWITANDYLQRVRKGTLPHAAATAAVDSETMTELGVMRPELPCDKDIQNQKSFKGMMAKRLDWVVSEFYAKMKLVEVMCVVRGNIIDDEVSLGLLSELQERQANAQTRTRHLVVVKTARHLTFTHLLRQNGSSGISEGVDDEGEAPLQGGGAQITTTQGKRVVAHHECAPYSGYLLNSVRRFIQGPLRGQAYLAIQWRVEMRKLRDVGVCVDALIDVVAHIRNHTGVNVVFLATDWSDGKVVASKSASCTSTRDCNSPQLAKEMRRLVKHTGAVMVEDHPTLLAPQDRPTYLGLMDKVLCVEADWFLGVAEPCGRGTSTFVRYVQEMRKITGRSRRFLFRQDGDTEDWEVV